MFKRPKILCTCSKGNYFIEIILPSSVKNFFLHKKDESNRILKKQQQQQKNEKITYKKLSNTRATVSYLRLSNRVQVL